MFCDRRTMFMRVSFLSLQLGRVTVCDFILGRFIFKYTCGSLEVSIIKRLDLTF